jgi:Tfp pilus assembly ATPase PilU
MSTPEIFEHWLRVLVSQGAADLFLVSGFSPAVRLNGVVTPVAEAPLLGEDIEAALLPILHAQAL